MAAWFLHGYAWKWAEPFFWKVNAIPFRVLEVLGANTSARAKREFRRDMKPSVAALVFLTRWLFPVGMLLAAVVNLLSTL